MVMVGLMNGAMTSAMTIAATTADAEDSVWDDPPTIFTSKVPALKAAW